jgi:hypothetical protein
VNTSLIGATLVGLQRYMKCWLTLLATIALYGLLASAVLAHDGHSHARNTAQSADTLTSKVLDARNQVDHIASDQCRAFSHVAQYPRQTILQASFSVIAVATGGSCRGCCEGAGCQSCQSCCNSVTGCSMTHGALPGGGLDCPYTASRGRVMIELAQALSGRDPSPARKPPRA